MMSRRRWWIRKSGDVTRAELMLGVLFVGLAVVAWLMAGG